MDINSYILNKKDTALIVVDVQSRLVAVMAEKERFIHEINKIIQAAGVFKLPIIMTEHYPRLYGKTIDEVKEKLPEGNFIKKMSFNCCKNEEFNKAVRLLERKNLILVGIEAHICIFQTALGLIKQGYIVHVPQEATSSRTRGNWQVGLNLMRDVGAVITSGETIIFQLLEGVEAEEFKEIMRILK